MSRCLSSRRLAAFYCSNARPLLPRHFRSTRIGRLDSPLPTLTSTASFRSGRPFLNTATQPAPADDAPAPLPITRFADLASNNLVDPDLIRNITSKMGIETMTQVQSLTINEALTGVDV